MSITTGLRYTRQASRQGDTGNYEERGNNAKVVASGMVEAARRAKASGLKGASGRQFAESFTRSDDGDDMLYWS